MKAGDTEGARAAFQLAIDSPHQQVAGFAQEALQQLDGG